MKVAPGSSEPTIDHWRSTTVEALVGELPTAEPGRTRIIAVDGHSASGKTTLAVRLNAAIAGSALVHTDDVAWNYSILDWSEAMAGNIIVPARAGRAVNYQPPGWAPNGRSGAIELPAGLDTLIIEGVGIGRRSLSHLIDVLIWVQSDWETAHERGLARDIATITDRNADECQDFWDLWMAEEIPFLEEEIPWSRAHVIVAGTGGMHGPDGTALAVHP